MILLLLNAAQIEVELLPDRMQRVCQRNTVSFNCRSNGTSMFLYVPGIISQAERLNLLFGDALRRCDQRNNFASVCKLLENDGNYFTGTLSVYASTDVPVGPYEVVCSVSDQLETTGFRVDGENTCQMV